jgi:glycine cleavage system H protein
MSRELIDPCAGGLLNSGIAGMEPSPSKMVFYKRSHFVTHLPVDYRYSRAHTWVSQQLDGLWRVGLTKFATRMLGEAVDHGFDTPPGTPVTLGQVIGWIEGFKAISEVFCAGDGAFAGSNPALKTRIQLVSDDPYRQGWLYLLQGQPDARCVDVEGYRAILDETIDRILEKQKNEENP